MNGRIRIIKQANVTTVIRTRSAIGQSRMMRITRIVQNGASIERARKAAPRAALNTGSKSARGVSLGSTRRARQRHRGRFGTWEVRQLVWSSAGGQRSPESTDRAYQPVDEVGLI